MCNAATFQNDFVILTTDFSAIVSVCVCVCEQIHTLTDEQHLQKAKKTAASAHILLIHRPTKTQKTITKKNERIV